MRAGRLTWAEAARRANEQRNLIMDYIRARSTPVGRAFAERAKLRGRSLESLIDSKTRRLFGEAARFDRLTQGQRDEVLRAVVEGAGRSDPRFNALMRRMSRAGRGLLILSLGVAVDNVASAENKAEAAAEEGALLGGGVLGGMAGGAIAGAICGPGAVVCSSVGAFAGAVAGAFGVSLFF